MFKINSIIHKVQFYLENNIKDIVLLIIRLIYGISFFYTGQGKFKNAESVVEFFNTLGIPAPEFHALLVTWLEMGGGLLMVAGLGVRYISLPLWTTMVVALFTAHREDISSSIGDAIASAPFPYLTALTFFIVLGAGKWSFDNILAQKYFKKP